MGRRGYPPEFRRKVIDLLEEGRSVAQVAYDLGIGRSLDLRVASTGQDRQGTRSGSDIGGECRAGRSA